MKLTIMGTGYVGLVTGADFACRGIDVVCVDIDAARIEGLQQGVMPFFEPDLAERVAEGVAHGMLVFTTDAPMAIADADIVMTAVGTPLGDDGAYDLRAVYDIADLFAAHAKDGAMLVNKSTVPVGTAAACHERISAHNARSSTSRANRRFAVVSNPEFLSQGTAVADTMHPTRIVVGVQEPWALEVMRELNAEFIAAGVPYCEMSLRSAETVKCAANAFLATKISFINEVANFCDVTGGNIDDVAHAVGLDPRIGTRYFSAGLGYGGGCLPKDVKALLHEGDVAGTPFRLLRAAEDVNDGRRMRPVDAYIAKYGALAGKTVAVWGLAFKSGTGDVRGSASIAIIRRLQQEGAHVVVHDPQAMESARPLLSDVIFADDALAAAQGADALFILTPWDTYKEIGRSLAVSGMNTPFLIDVWGVFPHVDK